MEDRERKMLAMDAAAYVAQVEFQKMREEKGESLKASDVCVWWDKHFRKAGHKRLGRILVRIGA